jgi:hypothetical protein
MRVIEFVCAYVCVLSIKEIATHKGNSSVRVADGSTQHKLTHLRGLYDGGASLIVPSLKLRQINVICVWWNKNFN